MVTNMNWGSLQGAPQENPQPQLNQPETKTISGPGKSWGPLQSPSTYQGPVDPTADESTFGYLARNAVSNIARAGERALGKFGDIQELSQRLLREKPEFGGVLGTTLHSMMGDEAWNSMLGKGKFAPQLPTSEKFQEATEALTGEYTKPKTKGEARLQEFSGDIGSVGRRIPQESLARNLVNNVGIPAAANVAKGTIEELGLGEEKANWAKTGVWLTLSLLNNVNARAHAANLMNQGRQGFGPNVVVNVPRYENNLNGVARNMLQGDPRSALAQQQIAGIRTDIANGQNTMDNLMTRYDAINAAKRDIGLFELNRADRRAAIRNIDQVRHVVRNEIRTLGASNPAALQSWENGVRSFATIHQSQNISNFVRNNLRGPIAKSVLTGLFGAGAFKAPLITAGAAGAVPAAYKVGQVAYRVWNDPTLARYYWESLRAAARQDAPVFLQNFNKLDKKYNKDYEEKSKKK